MPLHRPCERTRTQNVSSIEQLTRAISDGLDFLEERQDSDGHWQDFSLPFESDMWVTAYVGTMLSEIPLGNTRSMAERSYVWLQQVANLGRWAYADVAALDADSTIWASRLGEQLGFGISSESLEFLYKHLAEDDQIATYIHEDFVERYGDDFRMQSPGWYRGHPCVTSATSSLAGLPWRDRIVRALSLAQQSTGSWLGYWWLDPEYATALSIRASMAPRNMRRTWRPQRDGWPAERKRVWRARCIFPTDRPLRPVLRCEGWRWPASMARFRSASALGSRMRSNATAAGVLPPRCWFQTLT